MVGIGVGVSVGVGVGVSVGVGVGVSVGVGVGVSVGVGVPLGVGVPVGVGRKAVLYATSDAVRGVTAGFGIMTTHWPALRKLC